MTSIPSPLQLSAAEVQQVICKAMPSAKNMQLTVQELSANSAVIKIPFADWMRRPGNTISGPAVMAAADSAMYALIIGLLGPKLMAVTSNMNINFLRKPEIGNLVATATLLKMGKRLAYFAVEVQIEGNDAVVTHITGSYALPEEETTNE